MGFRAILPGPDCLHRPGVSRRRLPDCQWATQDLLDAATYCRDVALSRQSRSALSVSAVAQVAGWRTNAMQRRKKSRKSRRCRDCRFRGPSGQCLDHAIKSGWCGDWIWYLRGGKQCRRRYARPKDPRTVPQLIRRARLTAASMKYSRLLTEQQREACIAAGAKVQSRPRLAQSGPLTGQQYWIHRDAARAKRGVMLKDAVLDTQVRQPQGLARSTSGPHRSLTGASPEQHRRTAGPGSKGGAGRRNVAWRMHKAVPPSQVQQHQRVRGHKGRRFRRNAVAGRTSLGYSPYLWEGERPREP